MGRSTVRRLWDTVAPLPGGRWLISQVLSWWIPYTGSISPYVEELGAGRSRVRMKDRRRLRNHLRSLHALALANAAELAGGLLVAYELPADRRFVPVRLDVEYLKKARGTVWAEAHWDAPVTLEDSEEVLEVAVYDGAGEACVRARVTVRIGPVERGGGW